MSLNTDSGPIPVAGEVIPLDQDQTNMGSNGNVEVEAVVGQLSKV